jgi:hypothetical protein
MLMGDKREPGIFDNSKIKKFVPNFRCEKSFADTIKESVGWFMEDEKRRKIDMAEDKLIESVISAWEKTCPKFTAR